MERVRAAMAVVEGALRRFLPVDPEGELVTAVVAEIEDDPDLLRVAQVCDRFSLSERALQHLVRRRLGLTPKWLIQRRRPRHRDDARAIRGAARPMTSPSRHR